MSKGRLLSIVVCALGAAMVLRVVPSRIEKSKPITPAAVINAARIPAASRSLRPVYPYSVIPGGAYSAAELRRATQKDRVVAAHYADFNLTGARVVTLAEDRYQYVSYRLKDRVYWTRNKLRIPKGEILLTDGRNYARTRCGNRVANKPETMAARQPSERALSLPAFRPELLSKGEIKLPETPPIGELTSESPVLPLELARLAPLAPGEAATLAQLLPPIPISAGAPSVPVTPPYVSTPTQTPVMLTPVPPGNVFTPPPGIQEIPEPSSLYLFAGLLFGSLWFLTRMIVPTNTCAEDAKATEH